MNLFKKKKIYKVTWAFDSRSNYTFTALVKAHDMAHAWRKVAKKHYLAIDCREVTEVTPT